MKITSLLKGLFLVLISLHLGLSADSSSLAETLKGLSLARTDVSLHPAEAFKKYRAEIGSNIEDSIKPAACLLVQNYSQFSENDLKEFLSLPLVHNYLAKETTDLEPCYKRILLALTFFHGWGQPQDPVRAYELVDQGNDFDPQGLELYLRWCIFKEEGWRSGIRKSSTRHLNDLLALQLLMASAAKKFEPAQSELQRVDEYSGLLLNNIPILSCLSLPLIVEESSCLLTESATQLSEVTRYPVDHFYAPSAIATVIQVNGQKQVRPNMQTVQKLCFQATPAPNRLRVVWSHVIELMREEQREAQSKGSTFFVNFHTLQRDPVVRNLYIPLSTGSVAATPENISPFEAWFKRVSKSEEISSFFKSIRDTRVSLIRNQAVSRLKRLHEQLASSPLLIQTSIVDALISSGPFGSCMNQIEISLLKKEDPLIDELVQCICIGLSEARKLSALSLAHRSDHTGTSAEEIFYAEIFRNLFFLSLERMTLDPTQNVSTCMKPKHAALAFFRGEGPLGGWANPETLIDITYGLLRNKSQKVVTWLTVNADDRIKSKLKEDISTLEDRLWDFVADSSRKEVKREAIPFILMHEKINYLSDTPLYK